MMNEIFSTEVREDTEDHVTEICKRKLGDDSRLRMNCLGENPQRFGRLIESLKFELDDEVMSLPLRRERVSVACPQGQLVTVDIYGPAWSGGTMIGYGLLCADAGSYLLVG